NDHPENAAAAPFVGAGIDPAVESDILSAAGEVVYEWSVAGERLLLGAKVRAVLVVAPEIIATGRAYAALFDHDTLTSRHDVVLNGVAVDRGEGVPYEVQYGLVPGAGHDGLSVDDVGRWYAGSDGRPARARGVVRVINERHEREQRLAFLS